MGCLEKKAARIRLTLDFLSFSTCLAFLVLTPCRQLIASELLSLEPIEVPVDESPTPPQESDNDRPSARLRIPDQTPSWPKQSYSLSNSNLAEGDSQFWNQLPGVNARITSGSAFSLRGSVAAERTLTLLEESPLTSSSGLGPPLILLPQEILSSAEVYRGPSSHVLGRSALGGAVNWRFRELEGPTLRGELGSFDQKGGFVGLPLLRRNDHFMQTSLYRLTNDRTLNRATLSGSHHFSRLDLSYFAVGAKQDGTLPSKMGQTPEPLEEQAGTAALSVRNKFSEGFSQTSSVYVVSKDLLTSKDSPTENLTLERKLGYHLYFKKESEQYSLGLQVFHDFDSLSATFQKGEKTSRSTLQFGPAVRLSEGPYHVLSSSQYDPQRGLWQSGVALEHREPRASLRKWISFSNAYRIPTLTDEFCSSSLCQPNPDLAPETSQQVEIGFELMPKLTFSTYRKGFSSSFRSFATEYQDRHVLREVARTVYQTQNIPKATVFGFEGQLSWDDEVWRIESSITYLLTEDKDTKQSLDLVPEVQGEATGELYFGPAVFFVSLTCFGPYYDREFGDLNRKNLGNWMTADVGFRTQGFQNWSGVFKVSNLFDEPVQYRLGYPEPQRAYGLSIERLF